MQVFNAPSTALGKHIAWSGGFFHNAAVAWHMSNGSAIYGNSVAALTGVRILAATGNINGVFDLYGIKKS